MPRKLTPQQLLFIDEYIRTSNATRAYIFAYYTSKGKGEPKNAVARANSSEMLSKPNIRSAIDARLIEESNKNAKIANPFELVESCTKIIRADVKDLFDPISKEILPIPDMPDSIRFCISKIGVTEHITEKADGTEISRRTKTDVQFADKQAALNCMADIYGIKKNGTSELLRKALEEQGVNITINQTINNNTQINYNTQAIVKSMELLNG